MISIQGIEETEGSVVDKFLIVTLALDLSSLCSFRSLRLEMIIMS